MTAQRPRLSTAPATKPRTLAVIVALAAASYGGPLGTVTALADGEPPARVGDSACANPAPSSFEDVDPMSPHHDAIECLSDLQLVQGRDLFTFEPVGDVTVLQLASLGQRSIEAVQPGSLADDPPDATSTDDGSVHERAVNQLVDAGILAADEVDWYPSRPASRELVAAIVDRVHTYVAGPLPTSGDSFHDDDFSRYEVNINRLAAAGVLAGTGDGTFAPNDPISRAQTASAVGRLLDVLIEEGQLAISVNEAPYEAGADQHDAYTLYGEPFPNGVIRYAITRGPSRSVPGWESAVTRAMASWEASSPGSIDFVDVTGTSTTPDLDIAWLSGCHRDPDGTSCFDGKGGTLAHATIGYWGGTNILHMDDAELWSTSGNGIDVETVVLHELGHTLGLGHEGGIPSAVMYPTYPGHPRRSLDADDVRGVQALYPPKQPPGPTSPPSPNPTSPPPASPTLTLYRGASAPAGWWYGVTLLGFAPGARITLTCRDSVDPQGFYTETLTIDSRGRAGDATLCWSGDGPDHWVTGAGLESNHVTWSGSSPPAHRITLRRGASARAGWWYDVTLSGFAPGSRVTLTCRDSVDPQGFYNQTLTTDGSGSARDSTLCWSGDGPDHWVTGSGGVESNHASW